MSDAKEKDGAGQDFAPEQTPLEVAESGGAHVEASKEESSKAGTKGENSNSLQNGCIPVPGTGADALYDKAGTNAMPTQEINEGGDNNISLTKPGIAQNVENTIVDAQKTESKAGEGISGVDPANHETTNMFGVSSGDLKVGNIDGEQMEIKEQEIETPLPKDKLTQSLKDIFLLDENDEGSESGTEEEQSAFMKELENFFKEKSLEFKPPKFYGEGLNCLKLWRAVVRLGGYDKVTSCKLWRQVGEAFKPPKTCTTVSWTFRGFYEKALLD